MKGKLIFVAYFFYPNKEVAANRIRFWTNYLLESYPDIEPVVLTATPFSEEEKILPEQYYIPAEGKSSFGVLIKDPGLFWRKDLLSFFKVHRFENVIGILFTGGPFMHFSIIPQLKKIYPCPVLIDFRDPFSHNDRFHNSPFKKRIKSIFERGFIQSADRVISVNHDGNRALAGYDSNSPKFHVIPNGYDDVLLEKALKKSDIKKTSTGNTTVILTGKYYRDAPPFETFKAITELNKEGDNFTFIHYGGAEDNRMFANDLNGIYEMGVCDYSEVAEGLAKADIGVLITPGVAQNMPTKIFDYFGAELPILVISSGRLKAGNVAEVTADYPLVKWCGNEKDEIKKTLKEMIQLDLNIHFPMRENYSRRNGLKKLIEILENVIDQ
ncbi:MAG: hypothetical protein RIE58_08705 [Vicingaceae bacterium]